LKGGLPQGKGEIAYPNGDVFSGYFQKGRRTGQGKYKFANGDSFVSGFVIGSPAVLNSIIWLVIVI